MDMLHMPDETHDRNAGHSIHHAVSRHLNIPSLDTPFPRELLNLSRVRVLLQASDIIQNYALLPPPNIPEGESMRTRESDRRYERA